ncbi:MAG: 50S ribosomal protein L25 [Candidatus Paceibacterota bacterium]|jgi:large subunit ribosomal protein L25
MENLTMSAEVRDLKDEKPSKTRNSGYIPGIVYGPKSKNVAIKIKEKDFRSTFRKAGESTLVDLKVGGKDVGKIVISDFQVDPLSGAIIHFDLYQVRMDQKITAKIPIKFVGESLAVKNEGGIIAKVHDKIEIKCLPGDLMHEIIVDLSKLEKLNDAIRVKDLGISDKIEVLTGIDNVVVTVMPPRSDKEMEELEGKVEENVEAVEKVEAKEKKEGEEAEAEAPAPEEKKKEKKG